MSIARVVPEECGECADDCAGLVATLAAAGRVGLATLWATGCAGPDTDGAAGGVGALKLGAAGCAGMAGAGAACGTGFGVFCAIAAGRMGFSGTKGLSEVNNGSRELLLPESKASIVRDGPAFGITTRWGIFGSLERSTSLMNNLPSFQYKGKLRSARICA